MSSFRPCLRALLAATTVAVIAPALAFASPTLLGLYSFTGGADGGNPQGSLTLAGGYLWGTTCQGGANNDGTVYRTNSPGIVQTIHSFAGAPNDGNCPTANLLLHNNRLYGTTISGGVTDTGTIFSLDATNLNFLINYAFTGGTDGASPVGTLQFAAGELWGVTKFGGMTQSGSSGYGTIYRLSSANVEQQLFQFLSTQGPKQGLPYAGLTKNGNYFYGVTSKLPKGTIFRIKTQAPFIESLAYTFAGFPTDGQLPQGALLKVGTDFYGTTYGGGPIPNTNCGTVYKLDSSNVETIIYSFQGGSDGCSPEGDLVYVNGKIYGTTVGGGTNYFGTVFEIDPATNTETGLAQFTGGADGAHPVSGLRKIGAHMYGTATSGGNGYGTIFRVN